MKLTIGALSKKGNSVVEDVLDVLKSFDSGQTLHFSLVTPKKSLFNRNPALLSKQSPHASTLLGLVTTQSQADSGTDFLQLDDAALVFEGNVYEPTPKNALREQVSKNPRDCETTLQTLIEQSDGDYIFLMLREGWIAAGRDPVGVQPLYFGENRSIAAFATNKRALWKLGIENPMSFPPGNVGFANCDGFKFKAIKRLSYGEPKPTTLDDAARYLQEVLERSIQRRIRGLKEVAVAFSGGLDSSVVAFIASKLGAKVTLLHVSLENQPEIEEAIEAAGALDLPIQVHLFKDSDVEKVLPKVVELIEEPDPIKASIGVSFYWAAEKAAEGGFRVMLAGQGADELFGGYQRYVNQCIEEGSKKARQTMFEDIIRIHESNLERDLKITSFHDVELRLPFASFEVVEFALSLPIECKIEAKSETLRKLVLRKMASNIGMSAKIAGKPKKAVQYSTGINDAIRRLAKQRRQTAPQYINQLFENTKSNC
ncbi:MAG: asparagine synthetase B [Candidatus Bathyarchaeota archaeon]|nr:asparagine synthetase B [Candidatus Bathyarchaeota archaeon]